MRALPEVEVSRYGGDPAVDLFNTVDWRLDPDRLHERLATYHHVLSWMHTIGLMSEHDAALLSAKAQGSPSAAAIEHALILELRDETYRAVTDEGDLRALERAVQDAHANARLRRTDEGSWSWEHGALELGSPRRILALELERLLRSDDMRWFHRCEDEHCGWVFLDTSRQHNRRWCSSADCGNRNRVRAHYSRSRRAGDAR